MSQNDRFSRWVMPNASAVKARLVRLAVSIPKKLDTLSADAPQPEQTVATGWRRYWHAARAHIFGTLNIYRQHRRTRMEVASTAGIAAKAASEATLASRKGDVASQIVEYNTRLVAELKARVEALETVQKDLFKQQHFEREIRREIDLQRAAMATMAQSIARSSSGPAAEGSTTSASSDDEVSQFLNLFYARFEDRFRGAPEDISRRLAGYLPDIRLMKEARGTLKALDLGCGRGEWLALLTHEGVSSIGVDSNSGQIQGAAEQGLQIVEDDVFSFLSAQPESSYDIVSAIHLIEHLPLREMVRLLEEMLRVLSPGGMAIIETPNPESLLVGAWKFRLDPTHQNPLPPDLLAAMAEASGFADITIRRMSEDPRLGRYTEKGEEIAEIGQILFGPRDYAVIARKQRR